MKITGNELNK